MCCLLQVDEDNSGEIDFPEFCNVILKHKAATAKNQDEADTLDAFVALGGNVSSYCRGVPQMPCTACCSRGIEAVAGGADSAHVSSRQQLTWTRQWVQHAWLVFAIHGSPHPVTHCCCSRTRQARFPQTGCEQPSRSATFQAACY